MSDKTNIFASEHNESPAQVIRQTMAVSVDDDGQPVISFATNRGKGSGAQVLPVQEYREGDIHSGSQERSRSGGDEEAAGGGGEGEAGAGEAEGEEALRDAHVT